MSFSISNFVARMTQTLARSEYDYLISTISSCIAHHF